MHKAIHVFVAIATLAVGGMALSQEDENYILTNLFDDLAADVSSLYEQQTDGPLQKRRPGFSSLLEQPLLLEQPESTSDRSGKNLLYLAAAKENNIDVIEKIAKQWKFMLNDPAPYNGIEPLKTATPMHIAAVFNSNVEVLAVLKEAGGNVDATDGVIGATPLHAVLYRNRSIETVNTLIDLGANINATLSEGKYKGATPLHIAAGKVKDPEVISLLLEAGANKKASFRYGLFNVTPLRTLKSNKSMRAEDKSRAAALLTP